VIKCIHKVNLELIKDDGVKCFPCCAFLFNFILEVSTSGTRQGMETKDIEVMSVCRKRLFTWKNPEQYIKIATRVA
jgi:hypothetical protein